MKAKYLLIPVILAAALALLGVPALAGHSAAAAPAVQPPAPGHWESIYEEPGVGIGEPGERTLVADAAGNLHAVYGGVGLFYARRVNGSWRHERVDPGAMSGSYASLALDPSGAPHICYHSGSPATVRHAWRGSVGWQSEEVAKGDIWDRPCSIAAGLGGALAIGYRGGNDLMIALRDTGGAWHTERVSAGSTPDTISLLFDSQGQPRVAHSGNGLYYHYKDAGGWHIEKLAEVAYSASLALVGDAPRIVYAHDEDVLLLTRTASGWQPETIATGDRIYYASLALDGAGAAHVAFYAGTGPTRLFYSHRAAGGWETTDTGNILTWYPDHVTLVLLGSVPALGECQACGGYQFGQNAVMALTLLQPGGAEHDIIATTRFVGSAQKLAVEAGGKVHMVYAGGWPTAPAYLYQDASGWHKEQIPGALSADTLAVDSAGRAHVAYLAADGLRYGLRDLSGWHSEVVKPFSAEAPSLALDGQGRPHIVWREGAEVRVASLVDGNWMTEAAFDGKGNAPLLAVDGTGRLHVVFTESTRLRYAYRQGATWYRGFPAPLDQVEALTSLVVNPAGVASIAQGTRLGPEGQPYWLLKVNTRAGREWRSEELTRCDGTSPCAAALALDGQGVLSAAYVRDWPVQVHYARRAGDAWHDEVLATSTADRMYPILATALALDAAGRPVVSYYDPDILGLRVLRWVEGATATPTSTPALTPSATPTVTHSATPTRTATPRATQTPSLTCLTPTPAATYAGVPAPSGTIQRQVITCADDTYVRVDTGEILYDLAYVRMGARNSGAIPYVSGFLFRDVRVPRGADITSAKLRLQPDGSYEGAIAQVSIAGELHGQSGDFNPNNWWPQSRPRTVARVAWTLPTSAASAVDSPNIATIVEEIVALPDWKPGNNIAILIDPTDATNAWVGWRAYDGKPAAAAQLSLSYQPK